MQQKQIGVAIAGCGAITRTRHAPEYHINPCAEIRGFYDFDQNRAEELSRIYGGAVYRSFDELIMDEAVQAVSICTPNSFHAGHTITALRAGKDVLCEKPMAQTIEEAEGMLAAQREAGKILMLGHNQRLIEAHKIAKELLKEGVIGKILYIQTNFKHAGPERWSVEKERTWFFDKSKTEFGVLGDLGSHKIDLIRYLLEDEIDTIFATLETRDKRKADGQLIELDDNAVCCFRTRTNIPGFLHVSWTNYGKEDNSTIIYGSDKVMKLFASEQEDIVIESRDGTRIVYQTSGISTNEKQMNSGIIDAFVEAVSKRSIPPVTGNDGKITLACLEAAKKSSVTGTWQKVKV